MTYILQRIQRLVDSCFGYSIMAKTSKVGYALWLVFEVVNF